MGGLGALSSASPLADAPRSPSRGRPGPCLGPFSLSIVRVVLRPSRTSGASTTRAAARLDELAADDALVAPVLALDEHVGLDLADQRRGVVLVEHDHVVHRRERREHLGAVVPPGSPGGPPPSAAARSRRR